MRREAAQSTTKIHENTQVTFRQYQNGFIAEGMGIQRVTNRAQFGTEMLESDYNHILERDDPASLVQHLH